MNQITLNVQGMSCASCVHHIERILGSMTGVGSVTVDLANARVEVLHDPQQSSQAALEAALRDGGYPVRQQPNRCCCG